MSLNKKIVVVGSGIAGLLSAIILKKKFKYYLNHERLVIRTEHKKQFSKNYKEMFYEKIKFFVKNREDMNLKTKLSYIYYSFKLLFRIF